MFKNVHICFLTLIAASGFTLALLSAIAALWPDTPNQDGLAAFAFSLAVAFAGVLGNLSLFGAYLLIPDKNALGVKITSVLSVAVLILSLMTASIFFTEGLNAWFETPPHMPGSLIMLVRIMILGPLLWLCIAIAMRAFGRKDKA